MIGIREVAVSEDVQPVLSHLHSCTHFMILLPSTWLRRPNLTFDVRLSDEIHSRGFRCKEAMGVHMGRRNRNSYETYAAQAKSGIFNGAAYRYTHFDCCHDPLLLHSQLTTPSSSDTHEAANQDFQNMQRGHRACTFDPHLVTNTDFGCGRTESSFFCGQKNMYCTHFFTMLQGGNLKHTYDCSAAPVGR